ncbi:MAG: RsmG family class I SAM-dependent methyltransferase, partial [Candidatus Limnocylindrales bacterium]
AAGGQPPQVEVIAGRAETLAGRPEHRAGWDVVTVRAVADLGRLAELGLPLLRPGGWLVAWKRDAGDGALAAEERSAEAGLRRLGGAIAVHETVAVPGLADHCLVAIRRAPPSGGG